MKEEKNPRGVFEKVPGSGEWWIHFYDADGRRHRERVGKKSLAIKRYHIRKTEVYEGRFFPSKYGPTVARLMEELFENYRLNNQNLEPVETSWKRLKPTFAGMRAESVTTEKINRYLAELSAEGYANGSLNRDMAYFKRMFRLAAMQTPPKIRKIPVFPARLKEAPPRAGFVVDKQYRALLNHAGDAWLKAFIAITYKFGLRKAEALSLRVGQIDIPDRAIRLNPGETKNDEGRIAPLTSDVIHLLRPCIKGKTSGDFVFTRDDEKRVKDFRGAWDALTEASGLPGLLIHDFRRSAVRNMVRRGIPEKVAMSISGHKTRAVFDRYNIVSEADIREAGRKLEDRLPEDRITTATRTATGVSRGTRQVRAKASTIR